MISVITATLNASSCITDLIHSLLSQTDQDFEWVVCDGESTDNTIEIIQSLASTLKRVIFSQRRDFGIYDAINHAISLSSNQYYLVVGADDRLFPKAIEDYKLSISLTSSPLITHSVLTSSGRHIRPYPRSFSCLYGAFSFVSSHSVGLIVKRDIHHRVGFYSSKFPLAADQLFILSAVKSGFTPFYRDILAGIYNCSSGKSSLDSLGVYLESYRIMILTGHSNFLQTLFLFARLVKHCAKA